MNRLLKISFAKAVVGTERTQFQTFCFSRRSRRGSGAKEQLSALTIRSSRARFAAAAERRKIVTLPRPQSGPA